MVERDLFGKKLTVNYKGSESYGTYLGFSISMIIYVLVLIFLAEKLFELIQMKDPNISIIERPIYLEESEDFDEINL